MMEMDVFLYNTKSALLPAMKIESVIMETVHARISRRKAINVKIFSRMKRSAGDHTLIPVIKMAAIPSAMVPLNMIQEFIISSGFSALGRKRIIASPRPTKLSMERRLMTEITAAAVPTSATWG